MHADSGRKADLVPLHKTSVRYYPPLFENGYWNEEMPKVTHDELESAGKLFRRIRELNNKRLAIALRRLNLSSLRANGGDGLLDAMIGLEALVFGRWRGMQPVRTLPNLAEEDR